MGAITDIYEDTDTDVSEDKFREAVEQKVDQMEGLVDEETAAKIVAHELGGGEVETIADIETGMDEVEFVGAVMSVGDVRTFERDDGEGRVLNVDVADETGSVRLAFWDEAAVETAAEITEGDTIRVKGTPKSGYSGLEVSVKDAKQADVEVDVSPGEAATIETLTIGQSDVTLRGVVLDTETVRTFERDDGSEGQVANLTLGDETGRVRVTLWDERAPRAEDLDRGTTVEIIDGYVRDREGNKELHVGDRGRIDEVSATVEYDPETTPIETVEIGQTFDIAGVVRSTDPTRTFERDDGSEGQVRNIRLQDDTGDIRVALWGEKADRDIAPGDEVLVADAEIQDGWQDELEASAGWRSMVTVIDDPSTGTDDESATQQTASAGGATDDAVSDGGATGLDAFADGESPAMSGAETGDTVEFTGTVVQTGQPVVLDDGTETMSVETDATLRLGEEVTARGTVVDEQLDADEIL
jgi:replication factor A1